MASYSKEEKQLMAATIRLPVFELCGRIVAYSVFLLFFNHQNKMGN